ncbi:response regulator transcription factor [Sphaerisporangium sp. TRM90804]|uniref:response regulator transcription factor n=1 Tax=Sphaerisporangium sp. TRM90804 TaxID=3031113 RepID=UPI00244D3AEE|nr:response regulator transcription factor [Sphaerisporangium sp. TRM90804]MDH2427241.1 response regulator transcription factor [Sphaerisporangium sp. TRM90804]
MIRVLLADDQHLVRQAMAALLSFEDDIEVVGEVDRGDRVLAEVARHRPDVVLLDIEMPGRDGLAVAGDIRDAGHAARVVIVTTFGRPGYLRRAIESGAAGFVVKDARAEELADAIRRVSAGQRVVDPKLAAASLSAGASPLTSRECDVLRAAADGASIAEIAGTLFLSEGTVRNYLSGAIGKLGARNRAEAVRVADSRGWL